MALNNGSHFLDFDFVLGDHSIPQSVCDQILGMENDGLNNVPYHNGTDKQSSIDDITMHITKNQLTDNGENNDNNKLVKEVENPQNKEGNVEMEAVNDTDVVNETFLSSESGHHSDNESDFEELDLTNGSETNNFENDETDGSIQHDAAVAEKTEQTNDEIVSKTTPDEECPMETENQELQQESNEQTNNEVEPNVSDSFQNERDATVVESNEQSENSAVNEQNNDDDGSTTDSAEMETNPNDREVVDDGKGTELEESFEDSEVTNPEQSTEIEGVLIDSKSTESPGHKKRGRKRGWRKAFVKSVCPWKYRGAGSSPRKKSKSEAEAAADMNSKCSGTYDAAERDENQSMNDTLNSQGEEDTEGDKDDSQNDSKLRRTSRPPASRKDFFIDDDQLLNEIWNQSNPSSAYYRKKRNSLLFSGKKPRVVDAKPLTDEEKEKYSLPFSKGWRREIVMRGLHGSEDLLKKNPPSDVYYHPPWGSKLRSMVQVADWLKKYSSELTTDNFTFMRRPVGVPEGETVRNASVTRGRSSSEAHKRKRLSRGLEETIHDDNDPLYDKPEIVIERDSDEFLAPIIADSISSHESPSSRVKESPKKTGRSPGRGRSRKKIISPVKLPALGMRPVVQLMHPSKEKCVLTPLVKRFKSTARKSTTPRLVKKPIPFAGVENLCSMRCPGLEGIAPLLHCNVCMCLFHNKCVNFYGSEDQFTCLRCATMKSDGDLLDAEVASQTAPMQLDPTLVKTLKNVPLLSGPSTVTMQGSTTSASVPLYRSLVYDDVNKHRTNSPILVQKLQTPVMVVPETKQNDIKLITNIKQEPIDDSYPSEGTSANTVMPSTSQMLSTYLSNKQNKVSKPSQTPMVQKQLDKQAKTTPTPTNKNSLLSPPSVVQLPNTKYQLIPVGPPVPMYNLRLPGMQQQTLLTTMRPSVGVNSVALIRTPSPVPLQVTANNLLQISTASNQTGTPVGSSIISPSLPSPISLSDSGNNSSGPVVVNAKSCAPLNGQLLTLPPAVVKRLTLTKPLALKINNRQINVPPSGFFQTANGLKVFLPPNTFPTAEDNNVPEIDNVVQDNKTKTDNKTADKKDDTVSETVKSGGNRNSENQSSSEVNPATCTKSAIIRTSKRYKKLCFMKMLFGAYDCMECIFKYLNIRDLISASMVCKRWRTIAQTSSLWQHVSFDEMKVSDWKKAAQYLSQRQVKSISLVGLQHFSDPNRTWHQLVSSLQDLQGLKKISFGVVPASVLHSLSARLTRLESFCAEYISDGSSDSAQAAPCKLDIGKFACMTELKELKLKGVNGLAPPSFSFSGGMSELGSLCNLEVLSITSLQNATEDSFQFINQLLNIRELSLGNCTNWSQDTCERLSYLIGLEKLRLEVGSEVCQNFIGEAVSSLKKLHTLEFHEFPIQENLGSHLTNLRNLKKFVIYPPYSYNISRDNMNALNAVSELTWLKELEWIVPDKKRMSLILDDNENTEEFLNDEECKYVPFLVTSSLSEDEEIVAAHTEYFNEKELTEKLSQKLPKTKVKVYSSTVGNEKSE